jgi:hypothetical protein
LNRQAAPEDAKNEIQRFSLGVLLALLGGSVSDYPKLHEM